MVDDRDFEELLCQDTPIPWEVEQKTQQAYAMIRAGKCKMKRQRKKHQIKWKTVCALASAACLLLVTGLWAGTALSQNSDLLNDFTTLFRNQVRVSANSKDPNNYDINNTPPDQISFGQTYTDDNVEVTVEDISSDGMKLLITTTLRVKNQAKKEDGYESFTRTTTSNGPVTILSEYVKINGTKIGAHSNSVYTLSGENTYTCTAEYSLARYRFTSEQQESEQIVLIPDNKPMPEKLEISICYPGFTPVNSAKNMNGQSDTFVTNCAFQAELINLQEKTITYAYGDAEGYYIDSSDFDDTRLITTPDGTWLGYHIPVDYPEVEVVFTSIDGQQIPLYEKDIVYQYEYQGKNYIMIEYQRIPQEYDSKEIMVNFLDSNRNNIGGFRAIPLTQQPVESEQSG